MVLRAEECRVGEGANICNAHFSSDTEEGNDIITVVNVNQSLDIWIRREKSDRSDGGTGADLSADSGKHRNEGIKLYNQGNNKQTKQTKLKQ